MRVTILCPEALIADANSLAAVLVSDASGGPGNLGTFGTPEWQDGEGNPYAAASALVGPNFLTAAAGTLERPTWDVDNDVNMAGAHRAQEAFLDGRIIVLVGDAPLDLLAIAGVSRA